MVRGYSIYDPFVFLAPFVLKAKLILQELCKLQLGWDDKIPDELAIHWNHCHQDLLKLKDFKVNRCFKPPSFKPISVQLHWLWYGVLLAPRECLPGTPLFINYGKISCCALEEDNNSSIVVDGSYCSSSNQ